MAEKKQEEQQITVQKKTSKLFTFAVGRRKEAVARVRLYENPKNVMLDEHILKNGEIFINQKPVEQYFPTAHAKASYEKPFRITNMLSKFAATVRVVGGGNAGQLDAVTAGIASALSILDSKKYRSILKKSGLLTRDARVRERRKVGTGGKARRKKQSPKR